MKTKFKISLILLLAGIILASCNSSLSITKRRYNKGYYVHHNHKPASPKTRETAKALAVPQENEQFLALAKASETAADLSESSAPSNDQVLTASNTRKKSAESSGNVSNKSNSLVPVEFVKNPVKSFKALTEKLNTAGPAGEALSLLWILILILLLAYIAGLLLDNFGLGWVIHILLVIILVLFILWLLRIL